MILGNLYEVEKQVFPFQNLILALNYLKSISPEEVLDGRYQVNADDIIAIFQEFSSSFLTEKIEIEGHLKYLDVYYIVSGCEKIGWVSVDPLTCMNIYDEVNDVWKKVVPSKNLEYFSLNEGDVVILFPTDAHASQIGVKGDIKSRKIILKVAIT